MTMNDIEEAYRIVGEPIESRKFMVSLSGYLMIAKGFRRASPVEQRKHLKSIKCLIEAFVFELTRQTASAI